MTKEKKYRSPLGRRAYIFIILTVLTAVFGTAAISYFSSAEQIDRFYKSTAMSAARNFASLLDAGYLSELRTAVETDEFLELRDTAEEEDNEEMIEEYLESKGLWEKYTETRNMLNRFLRNSDVLRYLYILVTGDNNDEYDMYLMDDDDNPIYVTGSLDPVEEEFDGVDTTGEIAPTISSSKWGWLCSAYAPVYAADGSVVCHVGCDVSMDEIMDERLRFFATAVIGALIFTLIVQGFAMLLVKKFVVFPLASITSEMKRFKPAENVSYEEAGVLDLNLHRHDEIRDIYVGIREMQTDIINYLNNMAVLRRDNEQAYNDIREKDEQIGEIKKEVYRDALTGLGSKSAYNKAVNELNTMMTDGYTCFAVVMMDMNDLKKINDAYGHKAGDTYIKGCSRTICDMFRHSPVYRIGGDEFVSILHGKDYDERVSIITRLKEAFENAYKNTAQDPWLRYSAAVGMAECGSDDFNYETVFKRADQAMYNDKKAFKVRNGSYR